MLLEEEFKQKNPKQKIIMTENTTHKPSAFSEMKKIQAEYLLHHNKKVEINKCKYDDIMKNLKNLGIINN